jgi:hypothetical protein
MGSAESMIYWKNLMEHEGHFLRFLQWILEHCTAVPLSEYVSHIPHMHRQSGSGRGSKMSFIDDMKIWKKIIGGFLLIVLILVFVTAIGYIKMGELQL